MVMSAKIGKDLQLCMLMKNYLRMEKTMFSYETYYKSVSPIYDQIRLDHKNDFENTVNIILDQCGTGAKDVLDIGCGTGRYGERLNELGFHVIGIDKSSSQLEQASKIIETVQGDAVNLPFDDESFDVCTMILMLHHLGNKERIIAFSEVNRVLRKDGVLIIKTCTEEDLDKRLTSIFFPELRKLDSERYVNIETMALELEEYFAVSLIHSQVFISTNKEETIRKFSMRKSSNLGTLSDEQLSEGIARMREHYAAKQTIDRNVCNTFVIGKKTER